MADAQALLMQVRERYTQGEVAERLGRSVRTVSRWETGKNACPTIVGAALQNMLGDKKMSKNKTPAFTFIDLFAGIGGIRIGFERAGGECVFTSEWNPWSKQTYLANFGDEHRFEGDITKVDPGDIPDHDVLLGGFPCQPFSLAGVSKKNALGRPHGFECTTQGTLFFNIERIIEAKQPKAFLLENVKNLLSHDKGNTWRVIKHVLSEKLGYTVSPMVVDGKGWVPQHRERILIVGFREDVGFRWEDLRVPEHRKSIKDILHPQDGTETAEGHYTMGPKARISPKYTLTENLWNYLQNYATKHQAAGNGFGFGLVKPGIDDYTRTLSARYHKDGSEILIYQGKNKRPRRLTPRECARLMGFPDDFVIPVSDTQAYRQFGNSVVMPAMEAVAKLMAPRVVEMKQAEADGFRQAPLLVA